MPFASDVIEISDSDDDARPLPPPSSQFSQNSSQSYLLDLCSESSEDELPAPGDPKFFSGLGQAKRKRASTTASSSRPSSVDYPAYFGESSDEDESPKKIPRWQSNASVKKASTSSTRSSSVGYPAYGGESSDEEDEDKSPKKIGRKKSNASVKKASRKPRKTEEEKAVALALKQKEVAQKKSQKAAEKAAKAAQVAAEKEAKKEYKAANKLVNDKKSTLANMEIIFPPSSTRALEQLLQAFRDKVAEFNMTVSTVERQAIDGYDVFSWRRKMSAKYDPIAREWRPVEEPYMKIENTYLVYMSADELARCIRDEDGVKGVVRRVRQKYAPRAVQIFVMVDGLTAYLRRTSGIRYTKAQIEGTLAALQMAEHTHLLYVDKPEDAAARLYDLSADLGIKPYKLIERSHLPFCSDTQQTTGVTLADTWSKMIGQVHRMTASGALGIADAFPSANTLFEAYDRERDLRKRDEMVKHRADGVAKERAIGQALSRVVGTVMCGADPLALAYKACLLSFHDRHDMIITSCDHTGITVSDIERSLAFWTNVMGCKLAYRTQAEGEDAHCITGVPGAALLIAMLDAPGGHRIELLQYLAPAERTHLRPRPCDVGSVHVAFTVDNIEEMVAGLLKAG
ncbi:hypothetical protein B0H11DRAFT_2232951 [Mycena galericulata]|nr:hypothetical protein B0H11DRAFT_2232951 [Mycena galericulata]